MFRGDTVNEEFAISSIRVYYSRQFEGFLHTRGHKLEIYGESFLCFVNRHDVLGNDFGSVPVVYLSGDHHENPRTERGRPAIKVGNTTTSKAVHIFESDERHAPLLSFGDMSLDFETPPTTTASPFGIRKSLSF
jgi:hypothetical protein